MDIARLILDFLKVLSWPVVALLVAWMFRQELRMVVGRLTRADLPGGISLGFDYRTERLSARESRERAAEEQSDLPTEAISLPSPNLREGEIPIDTVHGSEQAYTIEQLAITKWENNLNETVERSVRISKQEKSIVVDGLVRRESGAPDAIVEVRWFRNLSFVQALVEYLPNFETLIAKYKEITGRPATMNIVIVIPQRIEEVIEKLSPLKHAVSETDWRVFILDYEDIGFGES